MSPSSTTRSPPRPLVDDGKVDGDNPSEKLPQTPKWKAYAVVLALIAIVLALVGTMAVLGAREGNARGFDPNPVVE